jgi:hypothetical protein
LIDPYYLDARTVRRVEMPGWAASRRRPRQGNESEGPRSGPHQRRGSSERVAPLSHLWTARRSCHGRPDALPPGLTALMLAHGLLRTDFHPWDSEPERLLGEPPILAATTRPGSMGRSNSCNSTGELRDSRTRSHRASTGRRLIFFSSSSGKREKSPARSPSAGLGPVGGGVRPVSCRAGPAAMAAARRSRAEPPSTGTTWSPDALPLRRSRSRELGTGDRPSPVHPDRPRVAWPGSEPAHMDRARRRRGGTRLRECPGALCSRSGRREHHRGPHSTHRSHRSGGSR